MHFVDAIHKQANMQLTDQIINNINYNGAPFSGNNIFMDDDWTLDDCKEFFRLLSNGIIAPASLFECDVGPYFQVHPDVMGEIAESHSLSYTFEQNLLDMKYVKKIDPEEVWHEVRVRDAFEDMIQEEDEDTKWIDWEDFDFTAWTAWAYDEMEWDIGFNAIECTIDQCLEYNEETKKYIINFEGHEKCEDEDD